MIYIFTGEDSYSMFRAVDAVRQELGAGDMTEANTTRTDGTRITPEELGLFVGSMPFLSLRRLVIVDELFSRFEKSKQSKGSKSKKSGSGEGEQVAAFSSAICSRPDSTIVVLTGASVSRSNPLFKMLAPHSEHKNFEIPRDQELAGWITRHAAKCGGSIAPDAASALARQTTSDLWTVANEVEKLVLFALGRQVTLEDVSSVTTIKTDASIFRLVDSAMAGNCSRAVTELKTLSEDGVPPAQILAMLGRQLRLVTMARSMLDNKLRVPEIGPKLGIAHDFVIRKTLDQARRFDMSSLRQAYFKLLEADLAMKTSRYEADVALNILVQELSNIRRIRA